MKQPKSVSPVEAWAIAKDGEIVQDTRQFQIYLRKIDATDCLWHTGESVIPVLITPIPKKRD